MVTSDVDWVSLLNGQDTTRLSLLMSLPRTFSTGWKDFSFTDFAKLKYLAMACESAQWGWPARHTWRDETLEYFRVYRHLRFTLAMAILRESILSSMNDLLKQLGFSSSFILKGLPAPADIRNCIAKLAKSEATFEDAMKLIRP